MLDLKIIPTFKHHIFLFFLQKVERPVPLFIFTYGYKNMSIKNGKGQDTYLLSPILLLHVRASNLLGSEQKNLKTKTPTNYIF